MILFGALAAACSSARDQELRALASSVDSLRAQVARNEQQIGDLSNQLFLISDQLAQRRVVEPGVPNLSVVRLVPEAGAASPSTASAANSRGQAKSKTGEDDEPPIDIVMDDGDDSSLRVAVARVPPPPAAEPRRPNAEAEGLLRDGLAAFREGRSAEAINAFGQLVQRFPAHQHADRALYWMGEARFEGKAYVEAIGDFRRLLERYPHSSKVPDALLKLGIACERTGASDKARAAFSDLVRNYPGSALGDLAKERLAALGSGGPR